jgi:hypothetical protein
VAGNEQRSRGRSRPADTSWDRVAGWYDGWVGSRCSQYHRALAIPAVLDLLDPDPDESILDIGQDRASSRRTSRAPLPATRGSTQARG